MHYKQEAKACESKRTDRIRRACGGEAEKTKPLTASHKRNHATRMEHSVKIEGSAAKKRGDRKAYKSGGRTRGGKTEVNIVIADPKAGVPGAGAAMSPMMAPHPAAPMPPAMPQRPPMPPPQPGMAPPGAMPPGMMPRKRGGRAEMDAGAGSGMGRLEKAAEYGTKP